jgi:hypothetical protein
MIDFMCFNVSSRSGHSTNTQAPYRISAGEIDKPPVAQKLVEAEAVALLAHVAQAHVAVAHVAWVEGAGRDLVAWPWAEREEL